MEAAQRQLFSLLVQGTEESAFLRPQFANIMDLTLKCLFFIENEGNKTDQESKGNLL
jgi:hypothetical protein